MYRYETHLHTYPVSKCARASVRDNLEFYKSLGYEGVFITNHFLDGNLNMDRSLPYEERIEFYFSDYEEGLEIGEEIGIRVFLGLEISYGGTDFLIYGIDKEYCLAHPEMIELKKSELLPKLMEAGFLVIQAHPYRQAKYIDHIRLYPSCVHGVEVHNANRSDFDNNMAKIYAEQYGLLGFAGSDNHLGADQKKFGGMESETPVADEKDFVKKILGGEMSVFSFKIEEE